MARIHEPTAEQESAWKEWLAELPEKVRQVAERFDPWSLYRMKSTGHRVFICGMGEDQKGNATLTVLISAEYNFVIFAREVFGIEPDDLEPCGLPAEDELTGSLLTTQEDVEAFCAAKRQEMAERN